MKKCPKCGREVDDLQRFCPVCLYEFGVQTPPPNNAGRDNRSDWNSRGQRQAGSGYGNGWQTSPSDNPFDPCGPEGKSRGVAAIFAILLGGIGVQYFYLGKITAGLLTILLTAVTCGAWEVVMVIQGILMFCMTNEGFRRKYVTSTSILPIF